MARNLPQANFVTSRWKGVDFCVRSNRKNRDSARKGGRSSENRRQRPKEARLCDEPERRLIQTRSPHRPRLSPLATRLFIAIPKDSITANFMLQTTIFSVNLCSEIADIKVCKE